LAGIAAAAFLLSIGRLAYAVDDGARAYWKGRDGSNVVSFQYLNLSIDASEAQQFAPDQYIYPNADVDANVIFGSWIHHMTLFNRASLIAVNIAGGNADLDVNTSLIPPSFLPTGIAPGASFSQSASGFADPSIQLDVNLIGTERLKSTVDLVNYEPTFTLDTAVLLALPIGQYDDDKLVNMGLNRWFGRVAIPMKYHLGAFSPGYRSSIELIPSVWLFDKNDDFVGRDLENDPLWQIEAHFTHDFTRTFFGSLDLLYRGGFQSEIDGVEVGDDLDIGNLGFTLSFQVTDNVTIHTSYSSNVFGDSNLDNSLIRLQFVYGWHMLMENEKKLLQGH